MRHELLERYGTAALPRYTSYPSANVWREVDSNFGLESLRAGTAANISLYVHVPFCRKLCLYCGCNMLVTHQQQLVERYLRALELEVAQVAASLEQRPTVTQLHLGGGTPTYLDPQQLERLMSVLRKHLHFADDELEASIEVHPPVTTADQLRTLASLGFTRVSMGVQDFDAQVQARINRLQPFEQTAWLIETARSVGFTEVNVDLMYGLPLQTAQRFERTLALVDQLSPDRVALFGYAHMPSLKKHQGVFKADELPRPEERLAILESSISHFTQAGYEYVGLDHFAKPNDPLLKARRDGTLRRNFMGYTTGAKTDVIAFGPSSISEVGAAYWQNEREVHDWCKRLEAEQAPVTRGWELSGRDVLEREVIAQLFCQLKLDTHGFDATHGVKFADTFSTALRALQPLEADGLIAWHGGTLRITDTGQLLLRNIAATFDSHLAPPQSRRHAASV